MLCKLVHGICGQTNYACLRRPEEALAHHLADMLPGAAAPTALAATDASPAVAAAAADAAADAGPPAEADIASPETVSGHSSPFHRCKPTQIGAIRCNPREL